MLEQDTYALTDPAELRALIAAHGWATLVTAGDGGLVVSHLPVLPDPSTGGLAVLGHLARTDAREHRLGEREVVLVVQGPHGYVSPSMYGAAPYVPTWNYVVAHLHGRPEVLDDTATFEVLGRTVDHFESRRPAPWRLTSVPQYARRIAPHTTGFRLRPDRVVGKRKLSQDKPLDVALRVATVLDGDDVHHNTELAAAMRRVLVPGE